MDYILYFLFLDLELPQPSKWHALLVLIMQLICFHGNPLLKAYFKDLKEKHMLGSELRST